MVGKPVRRLEILGQLRHWIIDHIHKHDSKINAYVVRQKEALEKILPAENDRESSGKQHD